MRFVSTFELTPQEAQSIRADQRDPEDYLALAVLAERDMTRHVEILRCPAGPHGPARKVVKVPLQVGLDAETMHYSQLVGPTGQAARSPVDGLFPLMPLRMILPQRNFNEKGIEQVRATVAAERVEWVRRYGTAPQLAAEASHDAPAAKTITIVDAAGNPIDPTTLPDNVVLRWDFTPVRCEILDPDLVAQAAVLAAKSPEQ